MEIVQKSIGQKFPTLICSQGVLPAKIFQSLARDKDFMVQGRLWHGSLSEDYETNSQDILSGKMLKELCLAEAGGTLPTCSLLFPKVGILSGGKFSTPKTSVFLKTGNVSLSSVLEKEVPKRYFLSQKIQDRLKLSEVPSEKETQGGESATLFTEQGGVFRTLNATDYKQPPQIIQVNKPNHSNERVYDSAGVAPTLNTMQGGHRQPFVRVTEDGYHMARKDKKKSSIQGTHVTFPHGKAHALSTGHVPMTPFVVASRGRNPQNPKSRKSGLPTEQMLEPNLEGVSNTLTSVEKDNYVFDGQVRKLMPIECERLMGWKDDHTKYGINEKGEKVEMSDSQRYKMCGNGVVSPVVKEIVRQLF